MLEGRGNCADGESCTSESKRWCSVDSRPRGLDRPRAAQGNDRARRIRGPLHKASTILVSGAQATDRLITSSWLVFVLAFVVHLALVWLSSAGSDIETRRGSSHGLVASAMLFHSLKVIFSPNHLPPDVPNHAVQASWLSLRCTTPTRSRHGLCSSPQPGCDRRSSSRWDASIGSGGDQVPITVLRCPYPPFFYMLAYWCTRWRDSSSIRSRVLQMAVPMAALMLVVVLSRRTRDLEQRVDRPDRRRSCVALEISVWHHLPTVDTASQVASSGHSSFSCFCRFQRQHSRRVFFPAARLVVDVHVPDQRWSRSAECGDR